MAYSNILSKSILECFLKYSVTLYFDLNVVGIFHWSNQYLFNRPAYEHRKLAIRSIYSQLPDAVESFLFLGANVCWLSNFQSFWHLVYCIAIWFITLLFMGTYFLGMGNPRNHRSSIPHKQWDSTVTLAVFVLC